MSHIRVKTTYEVEGAYGSTEKRTLYCHHNNSCDCVTFYDERGEVESMAFCSWSSGNDLWDAMERLMWPFKDGGRSTVLEDGIEHYFKGPWEEDKE